MNREQLAHVLRSAARVVDDPDIIVIGSQSILGTHDADDLPERVTMSMEADLSFRIDPGEEKSDLVDGAIGELSCPVEPEGFCRGEESAHFPSKGPNVDRTVDGVRHIVDGLCFRGVPDFQDGHIRNGAEHSDIFNCLVGHTSGRHNPREEPNKPDG